MLQVPGTLFDGRVAAERDKGFSPMMSIFMTSFMLPSGVRRSRRRLVGDGPTCSGCADLFPGSHAHESVSLSLERSLGTLW